MKPINQLTEKTAKEFGCELFKVTVLVKEQNEEIARSLIVHLFETYKKTYPEALITNNPDMVIEQVTFPLCEQKKAD